MNILLRKPFWLLSGALMLVALVAIPVQAANTLFTEPFDTDTAGPDPTAPYPDFTLSGIPNGGTGSVTGGVLKLDGGSVGALNLQRFTRSGFSAPCLTITGSMTAPSFGGYPIGIEFGDRRFVFHPGFVSGAFEGAFRVEDANSNVFPAPFPVGAIIVGNQDMDFAGSPTLLNPMKIEWNSFSAPNKVKITITDGTIPASPASPFVFTWTPDAGFDPTGAIGFVNWNGGVAFFDDLTVTQTCSLGVDIDIKPGSDPNCFNSNDHGVIPVAILGSASFDASTVDPFTVELDGQAVRVKGKSGNAGSLKDVNNDGFLDLVVQIKDDAAYAIGDTIGLITGLTFDGIAIEGSDSICITQ